MLEKELRILVLYKVIRMIICLISYLFMFVSSLHFLFFHSFSYPLVLHFLYPFDLYYLRKPQPFNLCVFFQLALFCYLCVSLFLCLCLPFSIIDYSQLCIIWILLIVSGAPTHFQHLTVVFHSLSLESFHFI